MNTIKIGNRKIGWNHPTYIIAEIGINHNGDLDLAKRMIDVAKECGVDCVKFQKRDLLSIYGQETLDNPHLKSVSLGVYVPILKKCELSIDKHFILKEYCENADIDYLCSPFDIKSANELEQLNVNAYKIPSVNLMDAKLVSHIEEFGKPIILSTGISTWSDIQAVHDYLSYIKNNRICEFMFLHCVSTYPVDFKDVNLKMIYKLRDLHEPVGYSGHERGIAVSACAVAMGASLIERHFTLDRTMKGLDHASSLEPEGLKRMCKHIRDFELARGNGIKIITRGEQIVRESLGKSPISKSEPDESRTDPDEDIELPEFDSVPTVLGA